MLHGNEGYSSLSVDERKKFLSQSARLVRSLPLSYFMLRHSSSDVHNKDKLAGRICRDLASLVFDHLAYFQSNKSFAVYYDDGQDVVSSALHDALDFVLARNVADYRDAEHHTHRLLQVADHICTVERAAVAYNADS